ncbi:hypothetical protein ABKV19_009805 [Rosa sericea]
MPFKRYCEDYGKLVVIVDVIDQNRPVLQLLYRLYASVMAIESTSKLYDEQWLAYWIIYSFLTLLKTVVQPTLEWYRGGKDHHDLSSKSPSGKDVHSEGTNYERFPRRLPILEKLSNLLEVAVHLSLPHQK